MIRAFKNIGVISHYRPFNENNGVFDHKNYQHGDDLAYPFTLLKKRLNDMGFEISTLDTRPLADYDSFLFFNYPLQAAFPVQTSVRELYESGRKLYLIINESFPKWPENGNLSNYGYFEKVFTWNDSIADGKKFIKYSIPYKIPAKIEIDVSRGRKLCTTIATNLSAGFPNELYSERLKAIKWFEENHPEDFDLYGHGWDSELFKKPSVSVLIKLLCLSKRLRQKLDVDFRSSYRGPVISKRSVLSRYKFSISYENVKGIPGYITEKILDCLFAGTIPVYLGASNIKDYVPENVFIDREKFGSYEALYSYMKKMPAEEYTNYIDNIKAYVSGKRIGLFSSEHFVDVILANML